MRRTDTGPFPPENPSARWIRLDALPLPIRKNDCLPMLRRRGYETLEHLLIRLDHAIANAMNEDTYPDEINLLIKYNSHSMRPVVYT